MKMMNHYYPPIKHKAVRPPVTCERCARRVFDYATVVVTHREKTISKHHYCAPCDRQRHTD